MTKVSRTASLFIVFALLLSTVPTFVSLEPEPAWAAGEITTVGNGSDPSNAIVLPGDTSWTVDAFTLATDSDTDTVSSVSIGGSADTTSGSVSLVKLYKDNNGDGLLDPSDTLLGTSGFTASTAIISNLAIDVSTSLSSYVVAYDIASGAPHGISLSGMVGVITSDAGNNITYNDSGSATLTVDATTPNAVSSFLATDGKSGRVPLSWVNPNGETTFTVRVLRRMDQYPVDADDTTATSVYEATETAGASVNILDMGLTNGQTYYYAAFTRDQYFNWNNTVAAGTTADTGTPIAVMVGDSVASVPNARVKGSETNREVGVFTLRVARGSDTVDTMTVTGGGGTGPTNISAARLFNDAGTLGVLDAGDTTIASSTFSGSSATFTSLSIGVNETASNYLITYDIAASPTNGDELSGYVSSATASVYEMLASTDTIDATLTIDLQAPGTVTGLTSSDAEDQQSSLTWTNPVDADLGEVKVVRKEGSYPTAHDDVGGTVVLNDTATPFDTAYLDTGLTNGATYFYAAFTNDTVDNWNNAVVAGTNADTATPQELTITFGNNTQDASGDTYYHGLIDRLMQSFTLITSGASTNWTAVGLREYGSGTATNNVEKVRLFRDDGDSYFDDGDTELPLSPATFSGEDTTFTLLAGESLTSSSQEYFVVYDLADDGSSETTVTIGSRLTGNDSIIVNTGNVLGVDPAKSSGTATLLPNTVTMVGGTDTAPSPTIKQQITDDFLRWTLTTDFGTAIWTGVTVDRTGTAADSDVSAVKIYKSTDSVWEASDTLIGQGGFFSGQATINFSAPNHQTITTAATSYYFVTLTISVTADVSQSIGASIDSSGTLILAPPDGIDSFSLPSSAPAIEENATTALPRKTRMTFSDVTSPTLPLNLTADTSTSFEVLLDWTAASDPETGIGAYNIYRSLEVFTNASKGSSATVVATVGPVITFTDTDLTGLISGETYYYSVTAKNQEGLEGGMSNIATATVEGKTMPHADYSIPANMCRICHSLHRSPAQAKLLRKTPGYATCLACHDGTGSDFNIQQVWADSAHDGTETVLYSSDTYLQCVKCHNPHGTPPKYGTPFFLVRAVEENLCFKCHSSTGVTPVASKNGWYIEDQMTSSVTVSRHAVIATDTLTPGGYYPEGTATTMDGLTGARIECTNCHNPMASKRGTLGTSFLVRLIDPFNVWKLWQDNSRSVTPDYVNFCLNCHNSTAQPIAATSDTTIVPYTIALPAMSATTFPLFPGWDKIAYRDSTSAHFIKAVTCQNCHAPHASKNRRLMAFSFDADTATPDWDYYYDDSTSTAKEENLCYQCHRASKRAGYESAPDIQTEFAKLFAMPITNSDRHTDTEDSDDLGTANRHSECYDCHDVHQATASDPLKGAIGIAVENGPAGVEPTYTVANPKTYEYEVCLKCHSLWTTQPLSTAYKYDNFETTFAADDGSFTVQGDNGVEFNPNNSSFHPVEGIGNNDTTPLVSQLADAGLSPTSIIKCTDCHNNNAIGDSGTTGTSSNYTGSAATGPHGSDTTHSLRGNYNRDLTFPRVTAFAYSDYDLCFGCHDNIMLVSQNGPDAVTNFWIAPLGLGTDNGHYYHLVRANGRARCADCHYNIHSNQETTTTLWIVNGIEYDSPPATRTTGLINYAPHITERDYSKPAMVKNDGDGRRWTCNLMCHQADGTQDNMSQWYDDWAP